MISKICIFCGLTFETKYKRTQTCSRSCTSKHKWSQPEYKDRVTSSIKIAAANPERNKKISEFHKIYQNLLSVKANHIERQKKSWSTEESRNQRLNSLHKVFASEEYIEGCKIRNTEIANRQNVKDEKRKAMLLLWESSDYQLKMSAIQKLAQRQESTVKRRRTTMLKKWSDPAYADKQFKSFVRYKEFILPSGAIIKLQGYEPQVLSNLLTIYDESDILTSVKNIHNCIGRIFYIQDNIKRSYYPDFYIESINTIIEVKSKYTFEKHLEKNLLKEQACLDAGFNFKFVIL